MSPPDVVYPVREGDQNEELRHSLRSVAANLPHRKVWIVGGRPPWLRNVEHLAVPQSGTKYANSTANVRAACEHPGVSNPFVLMNDDFFVMHPLDALPVLHRGTMTSVIDDYAARVGGGAYLEGMVATRALLVDHGIAEPLSYELHMPMAIDKASMLAALALGAHLPVLHKRSVAGNLAGVGGVRVADCKVDRAHREWSPDWPFLSTSDRSWRINSHRFARALVADHIRSAFAEPCIYEAANE